MKKIIFFLMLLSLIGYTFYNITAKAETKVETSKEIIALPDKDGDGIIDREDPHPDYPEIYIVEDKNRNGIVDQFENKQ